MALQAISPIGTKFKVLDSKGYRAGRVGNPANAQGTRRFSTWPGNIASNSYSSRPGQFVLWRVYSVNDRNTWNSKTKTGTLDDAYVLVDDQGIVKFRSTTVEPALDWATGSSSAHVAPVSSAAQQTTTTRPVEAPRIQVPLAVPIRPSSTRPSRGTVGVAAGVGVLLGLLAWATGRKKR